MNTIQSIALLMLTTATCGFRQAPAPQPVTGIHLADAHGKVHNLAGIGKNRAAVFFFISNTCPVSNRMNPAMTALYRRYARKNVAFYGVITDADVDAKTVAAYAAERKLDFPVLMDTGRKLTAALGARITPQAFVVSSAGITLYSGRINDLYVALGTYRPNGPTVNDVQNALDDVLCHRPVRTPRTQAIGCFITRARQ